MTNMTTFAIENQLLELKSKQSIEHSGIVKLLWQELNIQVPESKILFGVEILDVHMLGKGENA